jgi:hypothetical protein
VSAAPRTSPAFRGPFVAAASVFERILTGYDVEQWCLALLRRWSDTYLSEVERQHSLEPETLARVRAWVTTPSFDKWPEDQLPAVLLISVGLAEPPRRSGDGTYTARWQMGLGCVVSARTQELAHRNAQLFVGAHRDLLLQRPSLDAAAGARGVVWQDENYDLLAYDDIRTLAAGEAIFTVEFDQVANSSAGPVTPDEPLPPGLAWPPWQQVEQVDVQIDNEAISEARKEDGR